MIADSVDCNELTAKGISNDCPPAYVSNVSYGRLFYMLLETTSTSSLVESALKAAVSHNGIDITTNAEAKIKEIYDNTRYTFLALGGGTKPLKGMLKAQGDFKEINSIIANNCKFTKSNPGYPLMYTVNFLKDNSITKVNMATEYVVTSFETFSSGKLEIKHNGWYDIRLYFYWQRISGYKDGAPVYKDEEWSGNGKTRRLGFRDTILLDGNCRNIKVVINTKTVRGDILRSRPMPLVPVRVIETKDTAFAPHYKLTPNEWD